MSQGGVEPCCSTGWVGRGIILPVWLAGCWIGIWNCWRLLADAGGLCCVAFKVWVCTMCGVVGFEPRFFYRVLPQPKKAKPSGCNKATIKHSQPLSR